MRMAINTDEVTNRGNKKLLETRIAPDFETTRYDSHFVNEKDEREKWTLPILIMR